MSAKTAYPDRAEVRRVARELAASDGIEIPEGNLFVFCEEGGGGILAKYIHLARTQIGHFDRPQITVVEMSPYDLRLGCVAYVPEWCGWIEILSEPEPFSAARDGVHVQIRSTELSGEVVEHRASLRDWPLLVKADSIPKES